MKLMLTNPVGRSVGGNSMPVRSYVPAPLRPSLFTWPAALSACVNIAKTRLRGAIKIMTNDRIPIDDRVYDDGLPAVSQQIFTEQEMVCDYAYRAHAWHHRLLADRQRFNMEWPESSVIDISGGKRCVHPRKKSICIAP